MKERRHTMAKLTLAHFAFLALILLLVAPAATQTTDDISRLQAEIERNGELLAEAQSLVAETNSAKARASLQTAAELHKESVRMFEMGSGGGNMVRAAQYAARAREAILQTIAIAKRETKLEESALKAIERATLRLEIGRQLAQNADHEATVPRKLLDEAWGHLQRAQHNMRERLYDVALQLAVSSEDLSRRAIALLRRDVTDADYLDRQLEKTDRAIERLAEHLAQTNDDKLRGVLDEARELQRRAREAASSGQTRMALELSERARNLAMRGIRSLSSGASAENVERALELTDQLLDRAREMVGERDSDRADQRVRQAQELQDGAKEHYRQENYEQALRMTLRAREILKQGIAAGAHELDAGEVESALGGTDGIIARANETVSGSSNDVAKDLIVRAEAKQKRAREAFSDGRLREALANTRIARKLAQRAVDLANGDGT